MVFDLHHTTGFILKIITYPSIIQGGKFVKKNY